MDMVDPLFEIDTYRSKMGEDRDVCVLTFKVKDRSPAKDMMEFLEKGYPFVLDSDVSSGENDNGDYFVFVELPRTSRLAEQVKDLLYGVRKLTGIDDWQFRYHKQSRSRPLTYEALKEAVPSSPALYDNMMNQMRTEELKSFFDKTLMDDFVVENDIITIYKPYNQKIQLRLVKEDSKEQILEGMEEQPLGMDNVAMGEIFWLTKVLGDYNINKVGDSYVFENGDKAIVLQHLSK